MLKRLKFISQSLLIEEKAMSYSILEQETRGLDYLKLNVVMLNDAER